MTQKCDKTIDAFGKLMSAEQIKAVLKERGWNQKEVAEYWGVSKNWIYLLIKNDNGQRSVRDDCAFIGLPNK